MNMNVEAETEAGKEQKPKKMYQYAKLTDVYYSRPVLFCLKQNSFFGKGWGGGVQQGYWDSH